MIQHAEETTTVVFIMGCARSGSTILDIVLGNHEQMTSVGELRNWAPRVLSNDGQCACGEPVNQCEFWRDVRKKLADDGTENKIKKFISQQRRYELLRTLPRLGWQFVRQSADFKAYAKTSQDLYQAIDRVDDKQIIVDSSKLPAAALAVLLIRGIDLRIVHLVRDGRAVMWSKEKNLRNNNTEQAGAHEGGRIATIRHSLRWIAENIVCDWVAKIAGKKAIRVRYEDFASEPVAVLREIGQLVNADMSSLCAQVAANQHLNVGHAVAGNRVRMQRDIHLQPDLEWQNKLPENERRLFWRLAGWHARKYNYRMA